MAAALPFIAAAGSAVSILNTLGAFGGDDPGQTAQAAPTVAPPTPMPTPDDEAAKAVKRKQAMAMSQRRGRQSTILSDPQSSDLLGG